MSNRIETKAPKFEIKDATEPKQVFKPAVYEALPKEAAPKTEDYARDSRALRSRLLACAPDDMLHAVVDIETMGVGNDAAIYSFAIGFIAVRAKYVEYLGGMSIAIAPRGSVDLSTLRWHAKQHKGVDKDLLVALTYGVEHVTAVKEINKVLLTAQEVCKDTLYYSRGKDFDFPKMNHLADLAAVGLAWKFYNFRCLRDMVGSLDSKPTPKWEVTHVAGEDMVLELNELAACKGWRVVGVPMPPQPVAQIAAQAPTKAVEE